MYMYMCAHACMCVYICIATIDGFRKVAKPEQHTLVKSVSTENLEFWHTNFRRGHPELLHLVQRKVKLKSCVQCMYLMFVCACLQYYIVCTCAKYSHNIHRGITL